MAVVLCGRKHANKGSNSAAATAPVAKSKTDAARLGVVLHPTHAEERNFAATSVAKPDAVDQNVVPTDQYASRERPPVATTSVASTDVVDLSVVRNRRGRHAAKERSFAMAASAAVLPVANTDAVGRGVAPHR